MNGDLEKKIEAALKDAYRHGYHDGTRYGSSGRMSPKLWPESVPFCRRVDTIKSLIGKPQNTTPLSAALAVPEVRALVEALERIESITVHSGGKIHGVTALHWQTAFEMARDEAEFALAALRGEAEGQP